MNRLRKFVRTDIINNAYFIWDNKYCSYSLNYSNKVIAYLEEYPSFTGGLIQSVVLEGKEDIGDVLTSRFF